MWLEGSWVEGNQQNGNPNWTSIDWSMVDWFPLSLIINLSFFLLHGMSQCTALQLLMCCSLVSLIVFFFSSCLCGCLVLVKITPSWAVHDEEAIPFTELSGVSSSSSVSSLWSLCLSVCLSFCHFLVALARWLGFSLDTSRTTKRSWINRCLALTF